MDNINWYSVSVTDMSKVISILHKMVKYGLYDQLDYIITKMPLDSSPEMMTAFLRTVGKFKIVLPSWEPMVIVFYHELKNRGEDADSILRGLI